MTLASKRHALSEVQVAKLDAAFVAGELDRELDRTTQPAMLGPNWTFVRAAVREAEEQTTRKEKDELDAALQEATTSVAETAGSGLHQVQQVIKATGAAQFHALKVAVGPLVDEAKQKMEEYDGLDQERVDEMRKNHFSLFDSTKKAESAELGFKPEFFADMTSNSIFFADCNAILPDNVLDGQEQISETHLAALKKLVRTIQAEGIFLLLFPEQPEAAARVEASLLEEIYSTTDCTLRRMTALVHGDVQFGVSLLCLGDAAAWQGGLGQALKSSTAWKTNLLLNLPGPPAQSAGDARPLARIHKRWGPDFYVKMFQELGLAKETGVRLADADAGCGDLLKVSLELNCGIFLRGGGLGSTLAPEMLLLLMLVFPRLNAWHVVARWHACH